MKPHWARRITGRARSVSIASFTVAALATPARADNASLAEALFQDGRLAMRQGNFAEACPKLAESQRLDPAPGTLLNVALCEEREGRVATAWADYRAVADELPSSDPRVPVARDHAAALVPRLPKLRIVLPAGVAGRTSILLDGTTLGAAGIGVLLPVDPGLHRVVVEAPQRRRELAITLLEGETREARIDAEWLGPIPLERPAAAPAPASGGARRAAGWTATGIGLAGIVSSLVLGGLVLEDKGIVNAHCPNHACDATGLSAASSGPTFATAATVAFALGAASLGGGVYLIATAPPRDGRGRAGAFAGWQGVF